MDALFSSGFRLPYLCHFDCVKRLQQTSSFSAFPQKANACFFVNTSQLFGAGCALLPSSHPLGKSLRIKNLNMRMIAIVFLMLYCIWRGSLVLRPQSGSCVGTHILRLLLDICVLSGFCVCTTDLQGKLDLPFPFWCCFVHELLLCCVKKKKKKK